MFARDRTPADRVASLPRHVGPRVSVVVAREVDWQAWERERDRSDAQGELASALAAFELARKAIAEANRMFGKNAVDRLLISDQQRASRRRHAFIAINRARGRVIRARKALAKLADA